MSLFDLDSRTLLGTDIEYSGYPEGPSGIEASIVYPERQTVRVIVGKLGQLVRMSAPELDVVVEGSNQQKAWSKFLEEIKRRFEPDKSVWFSFDVGPTRCEEIAEGLNALEDENWSEPIDDSEL